MPKTLLLADDSVVIQKLVGLSFANEDVKLTTTDNGDDALARARAISPDLILADVVMPGMNGYELCEAIKADPKLSHTPVLLLTGTFEAFDEERARQVGSDGHITKPFEAQGLVDRVTELLSRERPRPAVKAPAAKPAAPAPASEVAADDTYDFFDEDGSDLGEPQRAVIEDSVEDGSFEFGSSEFEALPSDDEDPLAGESFASTFDTDFDLEPAARDARTIAVPAASPAPRAAAPRAPAPPRPPARTPAPAPLDATVIAEDFGRRPTATDTMIADDLFGSDPEPTAVMTAPVIPAPRASAPKPPAIPSMPPIPKPAKQTEARKVDTSFDFGLEAPKQNPNAAFATTVMQAPNLPDASMDDAWAEDVAAVALDDDDSPVTIGRPDSMPVADERDEFAEVGKSSLAGPTAPDPSDYDVSISDLGQPLARPMVRESAISDARTPSLSAADLSPMLRDRIHETLEKIAWEAFADLSDTIVRQVLQRVESTVWEIVPQMAETLIQEEIRRMKGDDE